MVAGWCGLHVKRGKIQAACQITNNPAWNAGKNDGSSKIRVSCDSSQFFLASHIFERFKVRVSPNDQSKVNTEKNTHHFVRNPCHQTHRVIPDPKIGHTRPTKTGVPKTSHYHRCIISKFFEFWSIERCAVSPLRWLTGFLVFQPPEAAAIERIVASYRL